MAGLEHVDTSAVTPADAPFVLTFTAEDEYGLSAEPVQRLVAVVNPCVAGGERLCRVSYQGSRCSTAGACLGDILLVGAAAPPHPGCAWVATNPAVVRSSHRSAAALALCCAFICPAACDQHAAAGQLHTDLNHFQQCTMTNF